MTVAAPALCWSSRNESDEMHCVYLYLAHINRKRIIEDTERSIYLGKAPGIKVKVIKCITLPVGRFKYKVSVRHSPERGPAPPLSVYTSQILSK